MKKLWLVAFAVGAAFTAAWGAAPSLELGRQLFASPELGSVGKSCATCHPGGKGLEEIAAYSDGELREMINFCIRDAMKGPMLDLKAPELESIFLYLRSLSRP
ncbi:MAG: cytochrome C [Desulfuromonadales bacterium]|nr:cytochrome C [Desulfuromonadales bacterium]